MTDEPENLTLKLLREIRAEGKTQSELLGKAMNAIMELAGDVKVIGDNVSTLKTEVSDISERLQTVEGRLNTIDSRLARIEKHTGLVKA